MIQGRLMVAVVAAVLGAVLAMMARPGAAQVLEGIEPLPPLPVTPAPSDRDAEPPITRNEAAADVTIFLLEHLETLRRCPEIRPADAAAYREMLTEADHHFGKVIGSMHDVMLRATVGDLELPAEQRKPVSDAILRRLVRAAKQTVEDLRRTELFRRICNFEMIEYRDGNFTASVGRVLAEVDAMRSYAMGGPPIAQPDAEMLTFGPSMLPDEIEGAESGQQGSAGNDPQ